MKKERLADLLAEINDELLLLDKLIRDIENVGNIIPADEEQKAVYEESLALKLHNFYTGIERIFEKIAEDINGGVPVSYDWHKRLLKTMSLEITNVRPPVISKETAKLLHEFLAFRHVVRNIYGFELDSERLSRLIEKSKEVFGRVKQEIQDFLQFLNKLSK
ncbi:MAG: hypothetical protein D4R73_04295 [Deltaproteobacteria bacterium]|nr:MAG: hypothetical protein D4R73_04295 [Deltaproteobacteria bacterium]